MEFAWNTQKNKMTDVKGKEMEQERLGKISNPDIDSKKTNLNYDLVENNKNLYQRIKARVEEVKPVSRIQKNSVVDYSNIITVPQDQYQEWGLEKSKKYLEESYNYFCKEFGKENVVSAKVHLDEATPHIHLHFVPVSEEGKLQARKVMTPQRINKIHTEAPKYLQKKGFDVVRGQGKTDKSLEINKFKAEKLQENINNLENIQNQLEGDLKAFKGSVNDIDSIKTKNTPMGLIKLNPEDYQRVVELAKKSSYLEIRNENLENKNSSLIEDIQKLKNENSKLKKLEPKNKELKKTIDMANKVIGSLSKEFQNEYLKNKKEIQEQYKPKAPKDKKKSYELER